MQRKIFRIEQMFSGRCLAPPLEDAAAPRQTNDEYNAQRVLAERREEAIDASVAGLERELALVREAIDCNKRDLTALIGERNDRPMARASGELGAAVESMEKATQKILHVTEAVDDQAKSLAASLKNDYERRLAQDIQEHAVKIYEACNFQDLAGQRIAKVIHMLTALEARITAMIERCDGFARAGDASCARKPVPLPVNGPRLDGDAGHADQRDIDEMFN